MAFPANLVYVTNKHQSKIGFSNEDDGKITYKLNSKSRQYLHLKNEVLLSCFLNCYLAVPRPTMGHSRRDILTNPMFIAAFVHFRPEGHQEPRNEVGPISPAERLVGFEPETFLF